jgi:NADPH:quinone reductase
LNARCADAGRCCRAATGADRRSWAGCACSTPTRTGVHELVVRVGGVFVTYGYAGGHIPPLRLWEQPHGVHLLTVRGNPEESIDQWRRRALQVMRWIEEGTLQVLIDRTYALEDAAMAHRDLESQETVGKLLLIP